MIIFIYSDSIAQGLWDSRGGWADRLRAYALNDGINKGLKNYSSIINLGVDGDTTRKLLSRLNDETKARIWPNVENAFIFAVGLNDTMMTKDKPGTILEDFEQELADILKISRKYSNKLAFINITPVDESFSNPIISSSDRYKHFTNRQIDKFNKLLLSFCRKNDIQLVDVNSAFKAKTYQKLLADGVHPNTNGHEIIYNTVLPVIKNWIN